MKGVWFCIVEWVLNNLTVSTGLREYYAGKSQGNP